MANEHLPLGCRPPAKAWTAEEDDVVREMLAVGASAGEIAARLPGRTRNSVIGRSGRMGVHLNAHASIWNPIKLKHLEGLYNSAFGYSRDELAAEMGMSVQSVRNGISRLRRQNGMVRHRPPKTNGGSFSKDRQPHKRRGKLAGDFNGSGAMAHWGTPMDEPVKAPGAIAVNFAELNANHCRYPVKGEGYGMLYCGGQRYDVAIPYCGFHFAIAYQPRVR